MDLKTKISSLSDIEKKTLLCLSKEQKNIKEISEKANLNVDSIRRAVNWLSQKEFAKIIETKTKKNLLTTEGQKALEKGLPEKRMLVALSEKEEMSFQELEEKAELEKQEFNIALGLNKRKAFVVILKKEKPVIQLTEVAKEFIGKETLEEKTLIEISENREIENQEIVKQLISRGLVEEKELSIRQISITPEGKNAIESKEFSSERSYNIHEAVPELFI